MSELPQALGDKTSAKDLAQQCGVPVIPGSEAATDTAADAMAFAESAGFPVMLKAAMGGGGRGMRLVRRSEALHLLRPFRNQASTGRPAAFQGGYGRPPQSMLLAGICEREDTGRDPQYHDKLGIVTHTPLYRWTSVKLSSTPGTSFGFANLHTLQRAPNSSREVRDQQRFCCSCRGGAGGRIFPGQQ